MSMNASEIKKLIEELDAASSVEKRMLAFNHVDKYKWSNISEENRRRMHEALDARIDELGKKQYLTSNVCGLFPKNEQRIRIEFPDPSVSHFFVETDDPEVTRIVSQVDRKVQYMKDILWSYPSLDDLKIIFDYINANRAEVICS